MPFDFDEEMGLASKSSANNSSPTSTKSFDFDVEMGLSNKQTTSSPKRTATLPQPRNAGVIVPPAQAQPVNNINASQVLPQQNISNAIPNTINIQTNQNAYNPNRYDYNSASDYANALGLNKTYNERFGNQDRPSMLADYNEKHRADGTNKGIKYRAGQVARTFGDIARFPVNLWNDVAELGGALKTAAPAIGLGLANLAMHPIKTAKGIGSNIGSYGKSQINDLTGTIDNVQNVLSGKLPANKFFKAQRELEYKNHPILMSTKNAFIEGTKDIYGQNGVNILPNPLNGNHQFMPSIDTTGFLESFWAHPLNILDLIGIGAKATKAAKPYMKTNKKVDLLDKVKEHGTNSLDKATKDNPNVANISSQIGDAFGIDKMSNVNETTKSMSDFNKLIEEGKTPKYTDIHEKAIEHSKLANQEQTKQLIDELTHGVDEAKQSKNLDVEEFSQKKFGKSVDDLNPDEWDKFLDEYKPSETVANKNIKAKDTGISPDDYSMKRFGKSTVDLTQDEYDTFVKEYGEPNVGKLYLKDSGSISEPTAEEMANHYATVYDIDNPIRDENGNIMFPRDESVTIIDGKGNIIKQGELPQEPTRNVKDKTGQIVPDDAKTIENGQSGMSDKKVQPTRQRAKENAIKNGNIDTTLPKQEIGKKADDYKVTKLEPGKAEGADTLYRNTSGDENIFAKVDNSSEQPPTLVNPKIYNNKLINKLKNKYTTLEDPKTNKFILVNKNTGKKVSNKDLEQLRDRLRGSYDLSIKNGEIDKDIDKFMKSVFSEDDLVSATSKDTTEVFTPSRRIQEDVWTIEEPKATTKYDKDISPDFQQWYEEYSHASQKKQSDMLSKKVKSFKNKDEVNTFMEQFARTEDRNNGITSRSVKIGEDITDVDSVKETEKLTKAISESEEYINNLKRVKTKGEDYTNKNVKRWASSKWDDILRGSSKKTTKFSKTYKKSEGVKWVADSSYDVNKGLSEWFSGATGVGKDAQKGVQKLYDKASNRILSDNTIPPTVKETMLNQLDEAVDTFFKDNWSKKPWNKGLDVPEIKRYEGARDAKALKIKQEEKFIKLINEGKYEAAGREIYDKNIVYQYASDNAKKAFDKYFEHKLDSMNNVLFIDKNGKPDFKKILNQAVKDKDVSAIRAFNRSKNSIKKPLNYNALSKEEQIKILDNAFDRYQKLLDKNKNIIATDIKKDLFESGRMSNKKSFNQKTGKYENIGDSWDNGFSGVISKEDAEKNVDRHIGKYQKLIDDYKKEISKVKTNIDLNNIVNNHFKDVYINGKPDMHNEEIIKYATEGLKRKYKNRPTTIKDFDIALESAKKNFAKEYQEKFLKGEDINTNTIKLENRLKQLEEENTYVAHNEKDDFHNKTHIFFDGENRNYDTDTIKNLSVSSDVAANRIVDAIKNNKTDSKLNGLATTINDIINADNSVINPVIHEMNKIFGFGDIKVFVRNLKTNHGGLYKTKNGYAIVINSNKPFERITINHEIGHLFLKNAKYGNPIISKICDECYNLTKAKDDFLKSIGCESVNDVNFKFENGKISLEDFINSFENKVKYETCAEELYVEGFANTNKYVDIEKFNSWYNDNIKNDVDDYLRKSYSTGDYYSKIYPKLIKRVNKFFDENSEVFNGQKYSRKSNTNSRVDTSLSSPWGGEVSEYSSYKIGKQDSRRTNARNSGANTYQRPQGMKGVFQEPSNNKATKYNSREEFNGVPEQPKTVADSKPIEYTPVSNNYLKDEFGSSYNSAKARKYIANTSKDTEKTLIELGLLDEAQAANRLKQQSILNGTDKAYFRSTSKSKTGIDINKDYNATANTKEGLFGKKTQKGVHETGSAEDITRYEINRNLHAHYTKNVIDYVANKLALPIKDGRIKDGYIGVNKNILSHMVHGRMSSEWYNTMVKGEEAIRKAFKDEGVANAWVEIANKNKADDFQIPKTVFNTLADGSAENAAVYWDRYARFDNPKGLVKGIGKYTKAVNEALLNGFKRRVLTSGSFFLNNRIGNQIMLYMHSDNAVDYLKSIFKAGTIKDIDVPNEIIQNNIAEAAKDALVRRTYTGHNAVDNAINLFNGQYIDTSSLKGMKKAGATGANIVIGLPNKAFNKVSEIVMKFNDAFEKFERKQRFSQLVDKEKAKLIKATGQKLVKDSEVIKHIKSNSEITEAVIREIEDTLGNYRTFNKFEKNIVKQIVPFYSWYRTISRHTMKFATKHPERVAKLRLELRAIGLDGKGHSDQKEYQRFAAPTGMIDSRSKKELLVNKEHAMPYNTFREDIGWNPYVQRGIEAVRGKKTFRNSEITNSRYTRQKKYDKESNRYKTAYWDAKNKDWVRDLDGNVKYESDYKLGALPLAPRVGYLAKGLITDTFAPYLNNSLVNAEQLSGAVSNRFTKDKNRSERGTWNTYDKNYDASFGGYNSGDIVGHQIAKGQWKNFERYASNNLSNKTKFVNALLGVGLQNKGELSKKEKLKAYKEKYKNRRKSN